MQGKRHQRKRFFVANSADHQKNGQCRSGNEGDAPGVLALRSEQKRIGVALCSQCATDQSRFETVWQFVVASESPAGFVCPLSLAQRTAGLATYFFAVLEKERQND